MLFRSAAATQDVSTQHRRAALFDGRHHLELAQAQVAALLPAPGGAMCAEDVRDLEGRTSHGNLGRVRGLKGADDFAQEIGRHLRIECGRLQLLVAEQDLNDADVDLLFEEVSRKTVSQDMHRDWLVDLGGECGGVDGPVELAGTDRLDRVQSREQLAALKHLALGTGDSPPAAQALKQHGGKHGVAVLVPLTLLDPQCHALAVDVAHLQPNHFAHAQSRAVGHRQRHLVFQVAGATTTGRP